MSKKTLKFQEIKITKMPGLRNGLKPYENLSPHINIIAGPNASGKSCTARAIQQLLWQNGDERLTATGHFNIETESWYSEVDSSYTRFQKEGNNADLKGIPSKEEKSRYMLSLHELIRKEEKNLAESILKDAIGGYDIEEAKNNLGYSDSKKTTNTSQFRGYKEVNKSLNQITVEQKNLQGEQSKLKELKREKDTATKALKNVEFYRLVKDLKEKEDQVNGIQSKLSSFPDKMEFVKEDDYIDFDSYTKEIQDYEKKLDDLETNIKKLKKEKAELNLPESGVQSLDCKKAARYVDEVEKLESIIRESKLEIEKVESELQEASDRLGLEDDDIEFEGLDAEAVKITEEFWQNGFDQVGTVRDLKKAVHKLSEDQKDTLKSDTLTSGISDLSKWLSTYGNPGKPISMLYLILVIVVVFGSVVAADFWGPIGYIGILLVAGILYLIYRDQQGGDGAEVSLREIDFKKRGLKTPEAWSADDVSKRLGELVQELEEAKRQENLEMRLSQKEDELKEANSDLKKFKEEADKLKDRICLIPGLDDDKLKKYSSLYYHLKYALDWDSARNKIKSEEKVISKADEDLQDWLKKLNAIFEKYGLESVTNFADAKAGKDNMQELIEQYIGLSRDIEIAESDNKRALDDKKKTEENLQKICNRLSVTPQDAIQVKELVGQYEGYRDLKKRENQAEGLLEESKSKLESHNLFKTEKEEIPVYTMEDVTIKIDQNEQEGEKLSEINRQIAEIETRVNDTKRKNDLEQALQKKEEALLELEELYKQNAGSIIGDLLVKHLKSNLGEKNMPIVFERAKSLFKRITKERYELVVNSVDGKAEFRAKDLVDGVGRSLEELSSGTRIQLIMSVRLAFIEQAEDEIKLPILADELLANSDSQRAGAIIDALIEISKEGRQIFYFTAQEDEVSKWKYKLEEAQITDYKVYIIEKNGESLPPEDEVFKGIQLHKKITKPGSNNYDEYGKALGVPPLNNVFIPVQQLHIWYFLDDTELLYKVMKTGIENWGMLKSYFKEAGIIKGLNESERAKIEQRVHVIEQYLEVIKNGQSKSIDRQVLEESGAISSSFIDEVANKLKEVSFDPEKLLEALNNGEVARFRNSSTVELEEYLISNGYIQQNEPYSEGEIQAKMVAFISKIDISTKKAQIVLNRLKQD